MQQRRNPIQRNESFHCENCGADNPKAPKTCRNHCRACLYSKHVDEDVPGDRLSKCQSLMEPIGIEHHTKKGLQIIHRCCTCGKNNVNKVAEDDSFDIIVKLSTIH